MSDGPRQSQLSDLVPGDDASIRRALDWCQLWGERTHDFTKAARAALLIGDVNNSDAREVIVGRLNLAYEIMPALLTDNIYKAAVAPIVTRWVEPVLAEQLCAVFDLVSPKEGKPLSDKAHDRYLAAVEAAHGEMKNLRELLALAVRKRRPAEAPGAHGGAKGELPADAMLDYVTLDQMAALVNRSKRTLEKLLNRKKNPLPEPKVQGMGGKASEWLYATVRPWLETEYAKKLPEHSPAFAARLNK